LPELLEEFDEFEELEPPEEPAVPEPADPALAEPELFELVPALAALSPDEPLPEVAAPDTLPVPDVERCALFTAACVEPGSEMATAPAAATLAKPTVTVVALRRRRPRSRSATAYEMWRAAALRGPRSCGDPLRYSGLLMLSVWHIRLAGLFELDLRLL
jgi:hypothetical protein